MTSRPPTSTYLAAFDYHMTCLKKPRPIRNGVEALYDRFQELRTKNKFHIKKLMKEAEIIESKQKQLAEWNEKEFESHLKKIIQQVRMTTFPENDLLFGAIACSGEMMRRTRGMTPYRVQWTGALALSRQCLAEMATGEGKTMTVALWSAVAGWMGHPVHVITANDYLAQRDSEQMGEFYKRCHLSTSFIQSSMAPEIRKKNYQCDIVYTSSKEILGDFLKDRIQLGKYVDSDLRVINAFSDLKNTFHHKLILRGIHTAIIDEADNVLIDEAVIPLRISKPYKNALLKQAYQQAFHFCSHLKKESDYRVDEKEHKIEITDTGWANVSRDLASLPLIWRNLSRFRELIEQTLFAREFILRGKDYIVQKEKIVMIDVFSGRVMPDRTWNQGLQQAVEAKENIPLSDPTDTVMSLSFQSFFRYFKRLSGLSGTASEVSAEFWKVYQLPLVKIPTNRPPRRIHDRDKIYLKKNQMIDALIERIARIHQQGAPILIGTPNVKESEIISKKLQEASLPFRLLNAVHCVDEEKIVEEAGRAFSITIATNMAGRGTDIKICDHAKTKGGLHVFAIEKNASRRIDRQLFGRAGRNGDPGYSIAYISLEDELISAYGSVKMTRLFKTYMESPLSKISLFPKIYYNHCQKKAESNAVWRRKQVMKSDQEIDSALSIFNGF